MGSSVRNISKVDETELAYMFGHPLEDALDFTTIDLCLSLFDWAPFIFILNIAY
jgi:hypothetical protein